MSHSYIIHKADIYIFLLATKLNKSASTSSGWNSTHFMYFICDMLCWIGGYDNCAILDIFEELLVLQNFFSCKITPPHTALQKPFLQIQRPPPLDLKKYFFPNRPKSFFKQSHSIGIGLTIPKRYDTWVSEIFLEIFFWKIFSKIFLPKIFLEIFSIPKCYTILESWDQFLSNGFAKNMILGDLEKNIFSNPKAGPFGFAKTVFAVRGGILQSYAKPNM